MKLLPATLQAFLAVTQNGTVHAAARLLKLTQTAVSRRILGLEDDLGVSLFLRSRRGMSLTDAGAALLSYCQQVIDLEGETLSQIAGNINASTISLVVQGHSSMMRARIIPAMSHCLQLHPRINIEYRLSDVTNGLSALKRGEADLVILQETDIADEFSSKKLRPERYILVGPSQWSTRNVAEIVQTERIIDFDPSDQITFELLKLSGLRNKARESRYFVNNTDALAAMVEGAFGYTALSADMAAPLIKANRLIRLDPSHHLDFTVAMAWMPRRFMPAYMQAVIRAVK